MKTAKRITLKDLRNNPLYNKSLLLHGNGKLLDYDNPETGEKFRYAQYNTRPIIDCPFASEGCKAVCYACKGNHNFPDVKESRKRSYEESKRPDFSESIIYTMQVEKQSKRYSNAIMLVRPHEAGEFYSLQYLKKWVKIWAAGIDDLTTQMYAYTKAFLFFLMLSEEEKRIVNKAMENGTLAIDLSLDDTTSKEQLEAYERMRKEFPLCNTYYCTEHPENVKYDHICECENCAKCGECRKARGRVIVMKIHSASTADMDTYRKNIRK